MALAPRAGVCVPFRKGVSQRSAYRCAHGRLRVWRRDAPDRAGGKSRVTGRASLLAERSSAQSLRGVASFWGFSKGSPRNLSGTSLRAFLGLLTHWWHTGQQSWKWTAGASPRVCRGSAFFGLFPTWSSFFFHLWEMKMDLLSFLKGLLRTADALAAQRLAKSVWPASSVWTDKLRLGLPISVGANKFLVRRVLPTNFVWATGHKLCCGYQTLSGLTSSIWAIKCCLHGCDVARC